MEIKRKPQNNALDVINKLGPLEYDLAQSLIDQYTPDAPETQQRGFIIESVEKRLKRILYLVAKLERMATRPSELRTTTELCIQTQ